MPDTLPSLVALVTGAVGWLGLNLLIKPWLEVLKLREEVQEELTLLLNVYPPNSGTLIEQGEEAYQNKIRMFEDAQQRIRRLGAKISARGTLLATHPFSVTSRVLRRFGYKLNDAGKQLLRWSDAYGDEDRAVARYRVEVALGLPPHDEFYAKSVLRDRENRRQLSAAVKSAKEPAELGLIRPSR